MGIREDFEKEFSLWYEFGERSYRGCPEPHHCALWSAKWILNRVIPEVDTKYAEDNILRLIKEMD